MTHHDTVSVRLEVELHVGNVGARFWRRRITSVIKKKTTERCFGSKRLAVIHTYIHTLIEVAAWQGADQHIRSSLRFSTLPKDTWTTSNLLIRRCCLYPWSTAAQYMYCDAFKWLCTHMTGCFLGTHFHGCLWVTFRHAGSFCLYTSTNVNDFFLMQRFWSTNQLVWQATRAVTRSGESVESSSAYRHTSSSHESA